MKSTKVILPVEEVVRQLGISYEAFILFNELSKELSEKDPRDDKDPNGSDT